MGIPATETINFLETRDPKAVGRHKQSAKSNQKSCQNLNINHILSIIR